MAKEQLVFNREGDGEVVIELFKTDDEIALSIENEDGDVAFILSRERWEKMKAYIDKAFE